MAFKMLESLLGKKEELIRCPRCEGVLSKDYAYTSILMYKCSVCYRYFELEERPRG